MKIVSCENPQRIYNKYINEYLHVPCRKCSACRNNKVLDLVNRIQFESQKYKFGTFFTLTYDPRYVPCFDLEKDENGNIVLVRTSHTFNKSDDGHFIESWFDNEGFSYEFINLSDYPEILSDDSTQTILKNSWESDKQLRVVDKYHAQTFIKRLRHHLNKFYNEELRFILVSEYGADKTKNYRPHYHGLFFYNSLELAKNAYKILCSCWSLGFVGASPPRGKCYSYVAKYINSLNYYPKIYELKDSQPFALYSRKPPLGTYKNTDKEVKDIIFNGTSDIMLYQKTEIMSVPFWRSLESRLFPKCREFSKLSHRDRVARYGYLPREHGNVCSEYIKNKVIPELTDVELRDFQLAKRVERFCYDLNIDLDFYVRRIEDYYNTKSLLSLTNFYEYQNEVVKQNPDFQEQLMLLYPEAIYQFRQWFILQMSKLDEMPFGFDEMTKNYFFRKFDPYFKMSSVNDWLDFDFSKYVLDNSSLYQKFVAENKEREKKNVKTKIINEHFNVL